MKFDTLIIGAGLSGLAAGIRLGYLNKKACILERHYTIGGLNSFYRHNKRNYDVGLHAVTNFAAPGQKRTPLSQVLRRLRIAWEDFALAPQTGSMIAFPHVQLHFNNDEAVFISEVNRAFPSQKDNFQRLIRDVTEQEDLDPYSHELSARKIVSETITDPLLVEMLLCPPMWYGNAREHDMDWGQFCVLFRSIYLEGFGRPFKGVRLILKTLVSKFRDTGGALRLRAGVSEIKTDGDKAIGVVLDTGEEIEADNIVSTAGWVETMKMCGEWNETSRQPGRLSFTESLSILDRPPKDIGYDRTAVFFNDSERFHWCAPDDDLVDVRTGLICSPNNFLYGAEAEEGNLDNMIRVTTLASYDKWVNLSDDQYRLEKLKWYDRINASAARFIPDYRGRIIDTDMFTPKTIRRFTFHENGAVYGAPQKQLDGTTHLDNLYIAGTDQGFLGIIGSMMSGVFVVNKHLTKT